MGDRRAIQKRLDKARYRFYRQEPESVAAAAKHFRLDPNDARQREKLLWLLADVVFGRGKKGRPKGSSTSWGATRRGNRLVILGEIYDRKKRVNPKLSDTKIAKLIKEEHELFENDDVEQIRQRLRKAQKEYWLWCDCRDDASEPEDWEQEPDYDDWDD
jgi:hypothetical protein